MHGLLRKEFVNTVWMTFIFGIVLFFFWRGDNISAVTSGHLVMFLYIFQASVLDHKNNIAVLIHSFPVTREEVVASRYIASMVAGFVMLMFFLFIHYGMGFFGGTSSEVDLFLFIIGMGITLSVAIPVSCLLGSRPFIAYMVTEGILLVMMIVVGLGIAAFFPGVTEELGFVMKNIMGGCLVVCVVISYVVSVGIYKKRVF